MVVISLQSAQFNGSVSLMSIMHINLIAQFALLGHTSLFMILPEQPPDHASDQPPVRHVWGCTVQANGSSSSVAAHSFGSTVSVALHLRPHEMRSTGSRWRKVQKWYLSNMVCVALKAKWIQFNMNAMRIETENGKCSKLNSQAARGQQRTTKGAAIIDTVVPQLSLWALFNATYNIDMDSHYAKSCSYC